MRKIIPIVLLSAAAYGVTENALMLKTRREQIGSDIRVVHISDLHKRVFGRNNNRLCERVRRENPDIIMITGDLVTRNMEDFRITEITLGELCRIAPVLMIEGNHEQSLPPEKKRDYYGVIRRTGAVLLKNTRADISVGSREISLYGLCEPYTAYKKNGGYRDLDNVTADDMNRYLGRCPDNGREIWLMAHNPLHGRAYAQWGADYTFSGHVHGGAIRIFGHGILSPERRFFPKFSKGVYTIGKMKLLVSAGLGKLRVFNPPEIVTYII